MLKLLMFVMFFFFILMLDTWFLMNGLIFSLLILLLLNYSKFTYFNLSYMFSSDILSMGLMILSSLIIILMILMSEKIYLNLNYVKMFLFNNLLLLLLLFLVFLSVNIFFFYFFFEVSLIPVLLLIIGWGYQVERIQAGIYLLFYTLFLSLPMLMGLMNIFYSEDCLVMSMIMGIDNMLLYMILIMSFLVKMPMFLVHIWLLKAHVEAPISGSMILAGVMLKLGGYGMIRVMNFFFISALKLNFFFIILSLVGGVYISVMCVMQVDMKLLIAMSSVVHMSMVIGGLMTLTFLGVSGSYLIMLGHGLCSSGLFVLSNLCYERVVSRSMMLNKGMINYLPLLSLWWFLLVSSNMASPPSLNLLGEITLMISLVSYSFFFMFLLMFLSFFSSIYNLYLYAFSQHGGVVEGLMSFSLINSREYLGLFMHWFPLNIMIFKVDFLYLLVYLNSLIKMLICGIKVMFIILN
uniref:NADH-ubiquinone oxidoreductase chain 4 n=1 Tax=Lype phaeopa TaxID=623209 RepID=A0A7D7A5E3_9NEOP|nr:NADH dehydrogenase subunit 4 [Lype phaeopa]